MSAPFARGFATAARMASKSEGALLSKGAKKDPELYILMAATCAAVGGAGYYLGAHPTSGTSEAQISTSPNSKPWEQPAPSDSKGDFKYQYHPGGNPANAPRDAPSALHSVIVPNVNLPKELHEKYNKWGKDGY
ncbi:hypothetical protein VC83_02362 [Pseudogymnoascus destructans]|uniref:Uncharacterized protein n=2 Tax=Pseudogymnoascus destructans TaxID=655981 RepID=L8FRQ2_PSED2|nr:uncharacterized protein VC83_02362 [Pseudogymnoascus destructans]ELR03239.1 hypothetical protein GMDG_01222 [Pseudogymnoascus destructans 20631-21]OAF60895.2 hypothetical protein VC83_02362 [Pseudogymnoascus destructans]